MHRNFERPLAHEPLSFDRLALDEARVEVNERWLHYRCLKHPLPMFDFLLQGNAFLRVVGSQNILALGLTILVLLDERSSHYPTEEA